MRAVFGTGVTHPVSSRVFIPFPSRRSERRGVPLALLPDVNPGLHVHVRFSKDDPRPTTPTPLIFSELLPDVVQEASPGDGKDSRTTPP